MGENKLPLNETNVIPFTAGMDREFDVLLNNYFPRGETLTMGDLSVATLKYIADKKLKANIPEDKLKIDKIVSEFTKRFLEKFPSLDNSAWLAARAARAAKTNMSDEDYEEYSRQLTEPKSPTVPAEPNKPVTKPIKRYSGAGRNMQATSNDDTD